MIKTLLFCAAAALAAPFAATHAAYPDKPIRLLVNFAPGGPLDLEARVIAEQAGKLLGQTVVVENRSGASGNIGAQAAAQAAPDGYTLLMSVDTVYTVNPLVFSNTNPQVTAMRPLSLAGTFNLALAVRPELGVKTLPEFLAYARKHPVTYSSAGHASPGNLAFEKLKLATGINATHVPYRGNAPATHALLSGEVDAGFLAVPGMLPHVQAGKLLPLAISGGDGDPDLPSTPPIRKAGQSGLDDYDVKFGFVIMAPAGLPDTVARVWEDVLDRIYAQPAFLKRLAAQGIHPPFAGAEAAQKWVRAQTQIWSTVISQAHIRAN